jgi:hypothetical protein
MVSLEADSPEPKSRRAGVVSAPPTRHLPACSLTPAFHSSRQAVYPKSRLWNPPWISGDWANASRTRFNSVPWDLTLRNCVTPTPTLEATG